MISTDELIATAKLLPPSERPRLLAEVLAGVSDRFTGITHTPGVQGGQACIARTRIPVWVLKSRRDAGQSDDDILKNYPTLTSLDLLSAWAYVAAHAEEIEGDIRDHEEDPD